MSQNASMQRWSFEQVDKRLRAIMADIYQRCSETAREFDQPHNLSVDVQVDKEVDDHGDTVGTISSFLVFDCFRNSMQHSNSICLLTAAFSHRADCSTNFLGQLVKKIVVRPE